MKKNIVLFILLVSANFSLFAQHNLQYSKVKIWLENKSLSELHALGLPTDHGSYKKDTWFITELSSEEINVIANEGFPVEILIEDVQAFYLERNLEPASKASKSIACSSTDFDIPTVQNYSNGSMGGFFTYQEILNNLDSMQAKYPNLISARAPIGSFTSIENRPIYWLRISNNPNLDDISKPEILYTALHHAREPASMQLLIYYMWFVLENYDSNPELQYVVDNTEMYFVPCVNPDGYLYNESTNPNGGGMHRKNRRNVGGSNKGVDLNRNYSYEFGGVGSSGNTNDDTYRGTGPFSEPETQALEWFTVNHNFQIALNYHSYADDLLFPWGYTNAQECPDHDLYLALSDYMVKENNYNNYQSAFLYEAAGDSDDWGYGEQNDKPKVFSMTPEVGSNSDGFWPAQNNILGICRENVFQNYAAAKSLLDNYEIKDLSPSILSNQNFNLAFELQRLGLQNTSYTMNLSALDASISNLNNPQIVNNLNFGELRTFNMTGLLDPNSVQNNQLTFVLSIATNNYTFYDTIVKYFGEVQEVFSTEGANMNAWQSTGFWGLDNDNYSAPTSISDSPSGNYNNNQDNKLLSNPIDLTEADVAVLEFFAKWEIEQGYDYAQVSASILGSNTWTRLCGNYTKLGNADQEEGEPLYDGVQASWVKESMDLSDFVGENIILEFRMKSDGGVRDDGFKFDDLKVLVLSDSTITPNAVRSIDKAWVNVYPNPTKELLNIQVSSQEEANSISIENLLGQQVLQEVFNGRQAQISTNGLMPGNYFLYIKKDDVVLGVKQVVIM
ncbi:MAG: immune inhibitor A [Chitinophagales bacterium]|nr:immune inhibitor A [Chitinophagales bacterium]